jgi:hypothetical protein
MKRLSLVVIGSVLALSACADASSVGSGTHTAGIRGKVLLGPMCPVVQAGSPCPDRPIEADITVTSLDGRIVATGHSSADGRYRISLPPGSYTVTAERPDGLFGAGKPITVDVTAGTYVQLNLLVDSGIR